MRAVIWDFNQQVMRKVRKHSYKPLEENIMGVNGAMHENFSLSFHPFFRVGGERGRGDVAHEIEESSRYEPFFLFRYVDVDDEEYT